MTSRFFFNEVVLQPTSLCNLNCSYCYMYNHVDQSYRGRPKFMSMEVFAQLVERIAEHLDRHGQKRMAVRACTNSKAKATALATARSFSTRSFSLR